MSPAPNFRIPMSPKYGSLNRSSPCIICCGRSTKHNIRHIHYSMQYYFKQCILEGITTPWCYHCNLEHPIDHMTRTKLFLSTSTLSGVPLIEGWPGLDIHCDWETIPGSQLDTLRKAWERGYDRHPLPVDTMLVGGLNDIKPIVKSIRDPRAPSNNQPGEDFIINRSQELFMERVRHLWQTIQRHSRDRDTDDTLAVSLLLHVPALYWHDHDGDLPSMNYFNYKSIIDAINTSIESFNSEIGSPFTPKLQRTGERTLGKGARTTYIWSRYREEEKAEMLHLKDKYRLELTTRLYKYFEHRTPKAYPYLE